MQKTMNIFRAVLIWSGLLALAVPSTVEAAATRTGEGVVIATSGHVTARYPVGPVHEGRYETQELWQGLSVGERAEIRTGNNGHLCMVLTPGVLIHVPPNTELTLTRLRVTADGLPSREEDLVRQVHLDVKRGRLYVNGGVPTASLEVIIKTPEGVIESNGSIFSLAQGAVDDFWSVYVEEFEVDLVAEEAREQVTEGRIGALREEAIELDLPTDAAQHEFRFCRGYFRDVEAFRHPWRGFDGNAIAREFGFGDGFQFVGPEGEVADVSPSFRTGRLSRQAERRPLGPPLDDGRRWSEERIWAWWRNAGVIRGVNYVPRTAVNSVEMWMEDSFDPETIDEELNWAQDLGYTAVRVVLPFAVWREDPDGFIDRFEEFLEIARSHSLAVVPVLFDDLNRAGMEPEVGPQPDPVPDVHNSRWVPSPGPSRVRDREQWEPLYDYVVQVVWNHRRDDRILYWDLYNTAGNDGLWDETLPLLDQAFEWVRDMNPTQPLSVAAWRDLGTPMAARKLERSDLITFETFENAVMVEAKLLLLQRNNRPIIASNWLMRQQDNRFDTILPLFSQYRVGWFNRGLVQGRTQMWIQEEGFRAEDQPEVWQHDVLTADGEPYDEDEIELIRGFRYVEGQ